MQTFRIKITKEEREDYRASLASKSYLELIGLEIANNRYAKGHFGREAAMWAKMCLRQLVQEQAQRLIKGETK